MLRLEVDGDDSLEMTSNGNEFSEENTGVTAGSCQPEMYDDARPQEGNHLENQDDEWYRGQEGEDDFNDVVNIQNSGLPCNSIEESLSKQFWVSDPEQYVATDKAC